MTAGKRSRGRYWGYALSGLQIQGTVRVMTLTSSPLSPPDIHRSFRKLVLRLRRRGYFEYLAVYELTESGLKHLHVLYRGDFIPQPWLSAVWQKVHQASVVYVQMLKNKRGGAGYLAKYLGKEGFIKFNASYNWVFRGWRKVWRFYNRSFKFGISPEARERRYRLWNAYLLGGCLWLGSVFLKPWKQIVNDLKLKLFA